MFVERLLPTARERLVTMAEDTPLVDAAKLLRTGTDLVVVCGPAGLLAGVITKTDIVRQVSGCQGASCMTAASLMMTRDVVLCRSGDLLNDVWARMKQRGLKNIPVVDQDSRPVGVLNARAMLQAILHEAQDEEGLLRDYVMSVGYH
ncbi:MAG: CBS domain-containing protein [Pseudomonadota bacterium]|nr:CBS domain-containing protein [Pseudomonadota bacterium]